MKWSYGVWVGTLALVFVLSGAVMAGQSNGMGDMGGKGMHHGMMHKGMHGNMQGNGGCPMWIKGAEVKVENRENGVVITVTAKDAETVKAIQDQSKQCLANKEAQTKAGDEMVTCPVMGTTFSKSKAVATREYKGKTYYLCCNACISAWDKNPEKYAK